MKMDLNRQERVSRYVRDRRCREGGYCFYRLEEPNSSDTYWALGILHLLGARDQDGETASFLKSFQYADGGFENLPIAYFVLKGLSLLGQAPRYDPTPYLKRQLHTYDVRLVPTGEASIFKNIYLLVDLHCERDIPIARPIGEEISAFVLNLQTPDGGYGREYGTLIETAQALSILQWLEVLPADRRTGDFISRCENMLFGYVNVPRTLPGYIEHIFWGLQARLITGGWPVYPETCREIILGSQNMTGGFSRTTHGGIANLENTFHAVASLKHLKAW